MAEQFLSDVRSILDSQGTIDAIVLIKTVGCTRATVDEDTVRRARDFHMDNLRQMDFINNPVDSHLIRAFHGVKQLLRAITENSRPELALVLILGLLQLFWDLYRIPEVPPALDLVDAAAWAATVSTDLHLRISAAAAAAPKAKAAPKPKPKPAAKPKAKAKAKATPWRAHFEQMPLDQQRELIVEGMNFNPEQMEIVERMLRNDTPTQEEMAAVFLAMLKRHVNTPDGNGLAERFAKCCVQVFFYANWNEVNRDLSRHSEMVFMTTTVIDRMSVTQSMWNIFKFIIADRAPGTMHQKSLFTFCVFRVFADVWLNGVDLTTPLGDDGDDAKEAEILAVLNEHVRQQIAAPQQPPQQPPQEQEPEPQDCWRSPNGRVLIWRKDENTFLPPMNNQQWHAACNFYQTLWDDCEWGGEPGDDAEVTAAQQTAFETSLGENESSYWREVYGDFGFPYILNPAGGGGRLSAPPVSEHEARDAIAVAGLREVLANNDFDYLDKISRVKGLLHSLPLTTSVFDQGTNLLEFVRDLFGMDGGMTNLDVGMENLRGFLARMLDDEDFNESQKVHLARAAMDFFWNSFELGPFVSRQATRRELARKIVEHAGLDPSTDLDRLRVHRADNFLEIVNRLTAASDIP